MKDDNISVMEAQAIRLGISCAFVQKKVTLLSYLANSVRFLKR